MKKRRGARERRRMRDLPISVTFVVYTLIAFLAGTLLCLLVISMCNRVRVDLRGKYAALSVTHYVPEGGRYNVRSQGRLSVITIYDAYDAQIEQFTVNHRRERLEYEAEGAGSGGSGENMGGHYSPNSFVVTPRYTGDDNVKNIAAITVSILVVPVSYVGALIVCAMVFFRRRLKRPIAILRRGSDRIAHNDLDFTVRYDSRNELGQLCDSFETMRGALERSNREQWRSMEERKRLNAAFSHDLRTPLTVLKGHAAMLMDSVPDGSISREEIVGELAAMSGSISRLERYVDAMASLQRLEDVEARREDEPFQKLASALEDSARILCADKALAFEALPGAQTVRVDQEIVQQVYENILANGARYAREALDIRVWSEMGRLLIRVRDDGPGFSPTDLEKGTEPFYRNKAAAGDAHLGLGLNICKILCQRHGGGIRLENDGGGCVTAWFN